MLKILRNVVLGVIGIPIAIVLIGFNVVIFMTYCLTLVGPLYHYYRIQKERKLIALENLMKTHKDFGFVQTSKGRLAYRWTVPEVALKSTAPVVFSGGLGSTLVSTVFWHDLLVRNGYRVLSYDRLGVGSSDMPEKSIAPPNPEETIHHMHEVLEHILPNEKWILIGGSFGNTVNQLFVGYYPESVAGLINIDGLPYSLTRIPGVRDSFKSVKSIYDVEVLVSKTGFLRPFIHTMANKIRDSMYKDSSIPFETVLAQLQSSKTLESIAFETMLMMDFSHDLLRVDGPHGWGNLSLQVLNEDLKQQIKELRGDYIIQDKVFSQNDQQVDIKRKIREDLLCIDSHGSMLASRWKMIPTCSLSGRNYDYDKNEVFMKKVMKDEYSIEHNILALLGKDGSFRYEFVNESHMTIVGQLDYILKATNSINSLIANDNDKPEELVEVDLKNKELVEV